LENLTGKATNVKLQKFVTVQAGARDGYQVPLALAEQDLLECFITDAYRTKGLIGTLAGVAPGSSSRHHEGLAASCVINDSIGFAMFAAEMLSKRVLKSQGLTDSAQRQKDRALSLRAFKETIDREAKLLAISYYAGPAFQQLIEHGQSGLLFQIHPEPKELKKLYEEEMELQPSASRSLMAEREMQIGNELLDDLALESQLAERIVVASSYTKDTLISQGIDSSKITICPYGVDFDRYRVCDFAGRQTGPLRIAFVGSVIQRKGLTYLLDAISRFSESSVEITFYTRACPDKAVLARYSGKNINLKENLSDEEVIAEMQHSDLFALPSIAEGFGHSLAEAMAVGLPAIASVNTMGRDCIEDGVDGLLVPIRSVDAIEEKIAWAIQNRSCLREMGRLASLKIRRFSWKQFRRGIRDFATQPIKNT
jgi:hypothetical protein